MSANDFAKAINEESEPESDEELRDALRQAQQNNDDNMGQGDLSLFMQLTISGWIFLSSIVHPCKRNYGE